MARKLVTKGKKVSERKKRVQAAALPPNAKKWVAALRSGKYEQAKDTLRYENSFCCLGVACDLAVKEGIIPRPRKAKGGDWLYGIADDRESGALPRIVMNWLGLRSANGCFAFNTLASMNDSGRSFVEIADTIESRPDGLFKEEVTA